MANRGDSFWHPVMGAVDRITQNIMQRRKAQDQADAKAADDVRQQGFAKEQIQLRQEGEMQQEATRKSNSDHTARMSAMFDLSRAEDLPPDMRKEAFKAGIKMGTDKNYVPENIDARPMTRALRPDVAKAFSGRVTGEVPLDVADKLEKQFDDHITSRSQQQRNTAEANKTNAEAEKTKAEIPKVKEAAKKNLDYIRQLKAEAEDYFKRNEAVVDPELYEGYMINIHELERKAINGTITEDEIKKASSLPGQTKFDQRKSDIENEIKTTMQGIRDQLSAMKK